MASVPQQNLAVTHNQIRMTPTQHMGQETKHSSRNPIKPLWSDEKKQQHRQLVVCSWRHCHCVSRGVALHGVFLQHSERILVCFLRCFDSAAVVVWCVDSAALCYFSNTLLPVTRSDISSNGISAAVMSYSWRMLSLGMVNCISILHYLIKVALSSIISCCFRESMNRFPQFIATLTVQLVLGIMIPMSLASMVYVGESRLVQVTENHPTRH